MAAKFKTAKQLFAQDKDFVLFPQAHTCVAHAVTATYKRRTYDLAETESDSSEKRQRVYQFLLPRTCTIIKL